MFVKKAYEESKKPNTTVVMLLPARTDTKRFHKYIWLPENEIRFIEGRLSFEINGKPMVDKNGRPESAPFPSMIVIFQKRHVKCVLTDEERGEVIKAMMKAVRIVDEVEF